MFQPFLFENAETTEDTIVNQNTQEQHSVIPSHLGRDDGLYKYLNRLRDVEDMNENLPTRAVENEGGIDEIVKDHLADSAETSLKRTLSARGGNKSRIATEANEFIASADNLTVYADNLSVFVDNNNNFKQISEEQTDVNSIISQNVKGETPCENRRFIVFLCLEQHDCRGWGDRQRGIMSTYLLALLTNRYFVVAHHKPCNLTNFFAPNGYNWTACSEYIFSLPESQTETMVYFANKTFSKSIQNTDFGSLFQKQVIFIRTNQIWFNGILAHPNASANLEWALGKPYWEIMRVVLGKLFRPLEALKQGLEQHMKKVVEPQKLICSHIRTGKNPSIPNDVARRAGGPNVSIIFNFLKKFDNSSKYVIYVASDSNDVRKAALGNFTNSFTVDLPIIHVDRLRKKDKAIACTGFYTVLLEQLLLAKCDTLVLTRSGFGRVVAYTSEKKQNIFYFDLLTKTLVNVTKDTLSQYL